MSQFIYIQFFNDTNGGPVLYYLSNVYDCGCFFERFCAGYGKGERGGRDEAILFQTMDSIANAVSDFCEPQSVPEIEPYTIDGRESYELPS